MNRFTWLALVCAATLAHAADWPRWGGTPQRNMVATEKGLPESFSPGKYKDGTEEIDPATTKNIKWITKLGSQCYGNPTVANSRIFLGTNNEVPRDPKYKGDYSIVLCLDEKTGKFLWQQAVPKLGAGKVSDWEYLGICSSPEVEGDRVYVLSSRNEVLCLDVHGMANGNDGPFTNEAQYVAGTTGKPVEQGATDGDIIWVYDMREELGVFPHNITSSSVLILGDRLYVTTSNGQDWSHKYIPSPRAPTLVCLDKRTGKLLGEEVSGISFRLWHCTWSSPAYDPKTDTVVFGAGDGLTYGFDPKPVADKQEKGFANLVERWRVDCIPPEYRTRPDGRPYRYPDPRGPSEIISTPVVHNGKVYVAIGQDPEHGEGVGALTCMADGKIVWQYKKIGRSISTVAIQNGLLFVADYGGRIFCLDAETGAEHWTHEANSHIWGSPLVADGKVYIGAEDGSFFIFAASKDKKLLSQQSFEGQVYSSAIAANGVLYVATMTHLYAIVAPPQGK